MQKKIGKVMGEFKEGTLHSGKGGPVSPIKIRAGDAFHHKNPAQAPAKAAARTAISSGSRAL